MQWAGPAAEPFLVLMSTENGVHDQSRCPNVVYIASKIQRGHDYYDFVGCVGAECILRCNKLPVTLEKIP